VGTRHLVEREKGNKGETKKFFVGGEGISLHDYERERSNPPKEKRERRGSGSLKFTREIKGFKGLGWGKTI